VVFKAPKVKTPLIVVKLDALNEDNVIPCTIKPPVVIRDGKLKAIRNEPELPNPLPIVKVFITVVNNGNESEVHTDKFEMVKLPYTKIYCCYVRCTYR
jgi:hypothetical protein